MSPVSTKGASPGEHLPGNLAAWCLLAGLLLLAALAGPFFEQRIYTADDLGAFHLPVRAFYAEQLAAGESYDWMPQLYSGFYLTGEGQGGVYHPLHQLLYRLFSLPAALSLECLLSYPWMMLGAWLWLRRQLGRGDAALFGALLLTFSSFNLLHFVHPNAVAIIAHVPWLLWTIDIVLLDSRRRRVALAGMAMALLTGSQLLLGYPQYVWFSLLAESGYTAFLLITRKYAAKTGCAATPVCADCVGCTVQTWPRLVIAKSIGLLLGGVQWLPTVDAWLHSARASADASFALSGSLHPLNVLQLVAPYMFTDRVIGGSTHEFGMYAGAVPLVLIVWLLVRRRELTSLAPLAWSTLGFAVVALLLAFGRYGVLCRLIAWIPGMSTFRFPCRYLVLVQLSLAILAAIGFALLTRECQHAHDERSRGRLYADRRSWLALWRDFEPLWCVLGFSAAVAVAAFKLRSESYIAPLPWVVLGPALLGCATVLLVTAARGYPAALVGLILFAAADLGFYGLSYSVYPRTASLQQFVASARTPPGAAEGRVVGSMFRFDEPGLRTGDLMTMAGWRRADGYAGLEPAQQLDYRLLPSLRVAGVRWVQRNASTTNIAGLKPYDDHWREVPNPLPRVRLVTQTRLSREPAGDIAEICPDTTALCETPIALPASQPGRAALRIDRPGRLEIDVDCPAPQLLVVAESYHQGWHAAIDGVPQTVHRINGDFIGCLVERGKHKVTLRFQPGSLQHGWITSCLGLGLVSLCLLGYTAQRPKIARREELT